MLPITAKNSKSVDLSVSQVKKTTQKNSSPSNAKNTSHFRNESALFCLSMTSFSHSIKLEILTSRSRKNTKFKFSKNKIKVFLNSFKYQS